MVSLVWVVSSRNPCYESHYADRTRDGGMIEAAHPACNSARVPDWNDFRYFLAIARSGSLAGAGA